MTINEAPSKTRPAPKAKAAKVKSKTPLLDAAKKTSPHAAGWDKIAAQQLAVEAINQVKGNDLEQFLRLANDYKDVAGWKNLIVGIAVKRGVITSRKFSE